MKILDVLTSPWAIVPEKLLEIQAVYFTHLRGEKIDLNGIEAALGRPLANDQKPYQVQNGVAIIDIGGVVAKKMSLFSRISGGVSTQKVKADFREALADPDVTGSSLTSTPPAGPSTARRTSPPRSTRPGHETRHGLHRRDDRLGCLLDRLGCRRIWVSGETPWVGSIGVVTSHVDYSQWEQKAGIKTTEIYAGRYKRIATEYAPSPARARTTSRPRSTISTRSSPTPSPATAPASRPATGSQRSPGRTAGSSWDSRQ